MRKHLGSFFCVILMIVFYCEKPQEVQQIEDSSLSYNEGIKENTKTFSYYSECVFDGARTVVCLSEVINSKEYIDTIGCLGIITNGDTIIGCEEILVKIKVMKSIMNDYYCKRLDRQIKKIEAICMLGNECNFFNVSKECDTILSEYIIEDRLTSEYKKSSFFKNKMTYEFLTKTGMPKFSKGHPYSSLPKVLPW